MYCRIVSDTHCALLALLLLTVFAAPGFGWRSWAQYRATGSTGFAAAGIAATLHAQLTMGRSWRIGVDHDEVTALVRTGVFGRVRNPIFSAMLLFGAGLTLLTPNVVALAGFALLSASIYAQVRFVEEPYLTAVHGDEYLAYAAAVGRFVPGVGLTTRHPARHER